MNFKEALSKMKEGCCVRRKGEAGFYYMWLPTQDHIWKIFERRSPPVVVDFSPTVKDLLADDWEQIRKMQ